MRVRRKNRTRHNRQIRRLRKALQRSLRSVKDKWIPKPVPACIAFLLLQTHCYAFITSLTPPQEQIQQNIQQSAEAADISTGESQAYHELWQEPYPIAGSVFDNVADTLPEAPVEDFEPLPEDITDEIAFSYAPTLGTQPAYDMHFDPCDMRIEQWKIRFVEELTKNSNSDSSKRYLDFILSLVTNVGLIIGGIITFLTNRRKRNKLEKTIKTLEKSVDKDTFTEIKEHFDSM